jgi:hypothetical protein
MFGRILTAGLVLLTAQLASGCCHCCHHPFFCRHCCGPACEGGPPAMPACGCETCYPIGPPAMPMGPPAVPMGPPVPPIPPGVPVMPVAPPDGTSGTGYAPMPRVVPPTATPAARVVSPVR